MNIAITGASGKLGQLVLQNLKQQVENVSLIALVRDLEKSADLAVTLRKIDYNDLESLTHALIGVDTLLLISGNELGKRSEQHANVINAAVQKGVKRIVYTSLLQADTSPLSLAAEHWQTEQLIKNSGLSYTILRNGWYNENYTDAVKNAIAHGALFGSAGNGKISAAAREDYAAAAAQVLISAGHEQKTYELSGDEAFTLFDLAAELSVQSGKNIAYHDLPEADYAVFLQKAGLPEAVAQAVASWDSGASHNALYMDNHQLAQLIGRKTTAIADSIKTALS